MVSPRAHNTWKVVHKDSEQPVMRLPLSIR